MSLTWNQLGGTDKVVAREEIAPHFVVKYTIWPDEDDMWFGEFEQWTRTINQEGDQYAGLAFSDMGIEPRLGISAMLETIGDFHADKVRPGIIKIWEAYQRDEVYVEEE